MVMAQRPRSYTRARAPHTRRANEQTKVIRDIRAHARAHVTTTSYHIGPNALIGGEGDWKLTLRSSVHVNTGTH